MFHFLVKYSGWAQVRDAIPRDRVFEYTDDELVKQFEPRGILKIDRISNVPALFVAETGGVGDQRARVGSINRVRISGNKLNIEYGFDEGVPPITNSTLERLSSELDIAPFEFSRTHWAIKNADLFKVLLRHGVTMLPSPKVLKLDNAEGIDDTLLSVMMPFDSRFDHVYDTIQTTAKSLKMQCLRADDIWENDAIMRDVVSLINRSRIIVSDCSGRNPNVFYETGIAHTLGRDVILITQLENDIPFDLRHLRFVTYLNNKEGRGQLSRRLRQRIQTLLEQPR